MSPVWRHGTLRLARSGARDPNVIRNITLPKTYKCQNKVLRSNPEGVIVIRDNCQVRLTKGQKKSWSVSSSLINFNPVADVDNRHTAVWDLYELFPDEAENSSHNPLRDFANRVTWWILHFSTQWNATKEMLGLSWLRCDKISFTISI
jgi:hypothetical protein